LGIPIVNLPGCPVQPNNITETLLALVLQLGGLAPMIDLDDQGRPRWLFAQTVHETCNRAGFAEAGEFAETLGDDERCLVKLGCKGPVVKCNVPTRGWVNGIGGCPNVGGICIGCTAPGFPDRFMPFADPDRLGMAAARGARFTYGPLLRYFRDRRMRTTFEREPAWRRPATELLTGHERRW
jgi:hydrogenase small subunit